MFNMPSRNMIFFVGVYNFCLHVNIKWYEMNLEANGQYYYQWGVFRIWNKLTPFKVNVQRWPADCFPHNIFDMYMKFIIPEEGRINVRNVEH